jgi:hypothetical protein
VPSTVTKATQACEVNLEYSRETCNNRSQNQTVQESVQQYVAAIQVPKLLSPHCCRPTAGCCRACPDSSLFSLRAPSLTPTVGSL